jgi:hypothetical protein
MVLTNRSGRNPVPAILSYAIYDRLLELDPVFWIDRFPGAEEARARRRATKRARTTAMGPAMTLALESYAGVYSHPAYGSIDIATDGAGALKGRIHGIVFPLRHVGGDAWQVTEVRWPFREGLRMEFRINSSGRVSALATPLADGPTYRHNPGDLIFIRARPARRRPMPRRSRRNPGAADRIR